MRIVAGEARGRKLEVPAGNDVRPTADRVREALFSYLGQDIRDAVVLDAFAGSGALGLESLSRGAARAVFIESNKRHSEILTKNATATGFISRCQILKGDAIELLKDLSSQPLRFDFIFLDPPYDSPVLEQALAMIGKVPLLSARGRIIAEHRSTCVPVLPRTLQFTRTRNYGNTTISTVESLDVLSQIGSSSEGKTSD